MTWKVFKLYFSPASVSRQPNKRAMSGYRAVDAAGLALCDAALYGIFLPVKIAEKVGIPALFPGLTESQRTAAEGKHRDYSLTGPETSVLPSDVNAEMPGWVWSVVP